VDKCKELFCTSPQPVSDGRIFAALPVTTRQRDSTVRALGDLWMRAIEGLHGTGFVDRRRITRGRKVRQKLLNGILGDLAEEAAAAWKSEERALPEQLPTDTPAMASSTTPHTRVALMTVRGIGSADAATCCSAE
jgi:hypothetical protein